LLVAHQDDDPRRVRAAAADAMAGRAVELRLERDRLALVDRDRGGDPATGRDTGEQLADDRRLGPAAQVLARLLDGDPLRPLGGDPADPAERVVGAVTGRADDDR